LTSESVQKSVGGKLFPTIIFSYCCNGGDASFASYNKLIAVEAFSRTAKKRAELNRLFSFDC
jgi:hypothetical protein